MNREFDMIVYLTSKTIIVELWAWMDGGSVTLLCKNAMNQEFKVDFVQNVAWRMLEQNKIPGRLYFDDELITQRSEIEESILANLENADYTNLNKLKREILFEKLEYIRSISNRCEQGGN